jgi:hypothetical protein
LKGSSEVEPALAFRTQAPKAVVVPVTQDVDFHILTEFDASKFENKAKNFDRKIFHSAKKIACHNWSLTPAFPVTIFPLTW